MEEEGLQVRRAPRRNRTSLASVPIVDADAPNIRGTPGASENDLSLVMRAETPVGRILLTGDAETVTLDRLVRDGVDVRADVLKVPHHGSRTTPGAFLDAVRPRVAVIGVGGDNTFGHPHPEVVETLTGNGARVFRTDEHGDIAVVRTGAGALAVVSDSRGTIDP